MTDYRVFCGGSWFGVAHAAKMPYRDYYSSDLCDYNIGLRLVRRRM